MAAETDSLQISENLSKLKINTPNQALANNSDTLEYGLPLLEVYKLAFDFYKGKAIKENYIFS